MLLIGWLPMIGFEPVSTGVVSQPQLFQQNNMKNIYLDFISRTFGSFWILMLTWNNLLFDLEITVVGVFVLSLGGASSNPA